MCMKGEGMCMKDLDDILLIKKKKKDLDDIQ